VPPPEVPEVLPCEPDVLPDEPLPDEPLPDEPVEPELPELLCDLAP